MENIRISWDVKLITYDDDSFINLLNEVVNTLRYNDDENILSAT